MRDGSLQRHFFSACKAASVSCLARLLASLQAVRSAGLSGCRAESRHTNAVASFRLARRTSRRALKRSASRDRDETPSGRARDDHGTGPKLKVPTDGLAAPPTAAQFGASLLVGLNAEVSLGAPTRQTLGIAGHTLPKLEPRLEGQLTLAPDASRLGQETETRIRRRHDQSDPRRSSILVAARCTRRSNQRSGAARGLQIGRADGLQRSDESFADVISAEMEHGHSKPDHRSPCAAPSASQAAGGMNLVEQTARVLTQCVLSSCIKLCDTAAQFRASRRGLSDQILACLPHTSFWSCSTALRGSSHLHRCFPSLCQPPTRYFVASNSKSFAVPDPPKRATSTSGVMVAPRMPVPRYLWWAITGAKLLLLEMTGPVLRVTLVVTLQDAECGAFAVSLEPLRVQQPMSLARDASLSQSSSDSAPLFLLSPVALRPMTSHARIEGSALFTKGERDAADLRPIPHKNFLPHLLSTADDGQTASTDEDTDSDTYRQKMWAGQANILVTVRLRPLLNHDRDREEIVKVSGSKEVVVLTRSPGGLMETANSPVRRYAIHPLRKPRHASASPSISSGAARSREKRFAFDYVFSPQDGQQKVYQHTTKFLIHGVLNGFNATVFAYGCTGAGKTYTMFGTPEEPGIMARTLEDLFRTIERVHAAGRVRYRVSVSFVEVYNENIRDLLSASSSCSSASSMPTSEFLDLREDPVRGSVVAGLSEVEASNAQDVMRLLRRGNKYRSQESTAANSVSSRSHAVLQVHIEQQERVSSSDATSDPECSDAGPSGDDKGPDSTEVKFGKLSLVDLAGSERAAVTQNRGQRLLEGANINRSLLALGNCINALGEKGASAGSFVPYRDSKLTRLLKDSLGGNCRTVMIANVSLAASSVEETLNTLKYANRAKNIKTTVRRNIVEGDRSALDQSGFVANLQEEIAALKRALLRQQELAESGRQSPAESERRWVESKNPAATDDNNAEEDDWKATKLREARQYITESFQERCRLRHALLNLEHQARLRAPTLQPPQKAPALAGPDTVLSPTSPLKAVSVGNGPQAQETSATVANTSLALSPRTADASDAAKKDTGDQVLASFARDREALVQQLARNEKTMDEFRRGIEQSPLMERNELIREVLLMEYRIGSLEMDKMQLQTLRDLQMGVSASLEGQHGNNDELISEPLDVRFLSQGKSDLHLDLPALASESSQPQTSGRDSGRVLLPDIKPGKTSSGRGGFLEELREHLYPSKSNSRRETHQQAAQASPAAFHKNWGIHLNNASLPYIRLKKKNPVPLYVEPTGSLAATIALGKSPSATLVAEPYLKSLKTRHKPARSSGKNHSKKST